MGLFKKSKEETKKFIVAEIVRMALSGGDILESFLLKLSPALDIVTKEDPTRKFKIVSEFCILWIRFIEMLLQQATGQIKNEHVRDLGVQVSVSVVFDFFGMSETYAANKQRIDEFIQRLNESASNYKDCKVMVVNSLADDPPGLVDEEGFLNVMAKRVEKVIKPEGVDSTHLLRNMTITHLGTIIFSEGKKLRKSLMTLAD